MKKNIDNTSGFSFVLYSTLISFVLANNLESEEQAILGIFLEDIGSNLLSISAFNKYIEEKDGNEPSSGTYTKPLTF